MTIVLHSDDKNSYKIVQLSLDTGTRYSSDITLTIARISAASINLARLKETIVRDETTGIPEDPEKIALDSEEMDALVDAWTSFKAEQEAKKRAEEERQGRILADASNFAATVKTDLPGLCITIEANTDIADYYHVRVPALDYRRHCHVDQLVWSVQDLIDQAEKYIVRNENLSEGYRNSRQPEVLAKYAAQIAAWRAVRPLPVVVSTEQGVTLEDSAVAEDMSQEIF